MNTLMRARRALLYMPGDDLRKIRKATTLDVDCVCMDMEDGVALNRKAEARQTIAEALRTLDFGRSERLARINAIGSGFEAEDLADRAARPPGWHRDPQGGKRRADPLGERRVIAESRGRPRLAGQAASACWWWSRRPAASST